MSSKTRTRLGGLDLVFSEAAEKAIPLGEVRKVWNIIGANWKAYIRPLEIPGGGVIPYYSCKTSSGKEFLLLFILEPDGDEYFYVALPSELKEGWN